VRSALDSLTRGGVISAFHEGVAPVWSVGPDRHLEAAFYRNGVIHFFVNRAIAELVLARVAEGGGADLQEEGWKEALRLRDLLKFEFFFPRKRDFGVEIREELALFDPDWESRPLEPEQVWSVLADAPLHLAHRVLRPFLEAYQVVADRLADRDPSEPIDEDALVAECTGAAQQYRLQRRLHSAESISRETFKTALRLAANRGLLEPGGDDLAERRRAFAEELRAEVRRVGALRGLDSAEAVR
jgi:glycerol-3-phosphate O-acyltransferase